MSRASGEPLLLTDWLSRALADLGKEAEQSIDGLPSSTDRPRWPRHAWQRGEPRCVGTLVFLCRRPIGIAVRSMSGDGKIAISRPAWMDCCATRPGRRAFRRSKRARRLMSSGERFMINLRQMRRTGQCATWPRRVACRGLLRQAHQETTETWRLPLSRGATAGHQYLHRDA